MVKGNGGLKNFGLVALDGGLILLAIALSFYLRFDWVIPAGWFETMERVMLPVVLINLATYFAIGFYRRAWRYTSVDDLFLVMMAVTAGVVFTYAYGLFFIALPRSVYIITWLLLLLMVSGSRVLIRLLADYLSRPPASTGKKHKAVIVGAGEAGVLVARELKKHSSALAIKVIGFIDDDLSKQKQLIQGLPVLGGSSDLPDLVQHHNLAEVIIAMPSAPYRVLQTIIASCADLQVQIKTVPGIYEIVKGQVSISALKEVGIEDLLQRMPVEVDIKSIADYLAGQVVLVTGAGGSIGSELCRQISELSPAKLLILDHDENGIFYCQLDLQKLHPEVAVVPLVRDIQARAGLKAVFEQYWPAVVFHAAAYKHVPLMEANVEEVVRNNIEGSINLIDLAEEFGVKRFVSISTDKAVNPSSAMGSSKRVVEIYLKGKAKVSKGTVFCAVRFGNVLGSQGSVVEIFRRQIAGGGPVTVTDPEMKRYFMTITEAVQLVIQAGALGKGGEIFVLDMGEPIKIIDLARDMIILSGLKPDRDIKIEYTGLRPGEKLYEELFNDRENFALTNHERIFIAPDTDWDEKEIFNELDQLGERLGLGTSLVELINGHKRQN